jgi:Transglutaminase-like superfamily
VRYYVKVHSLTPWQLAKRYLRLSLFLAEAFFELCVARFKVSFVPFQVYKRGLGEHMHTTSHQGFQSEHLFAKQFKWAIQKMAGVTPFKSNCMVQAVAAKAVFKKRGLATTLYIGVAKGQEAQQKLNHAWLRSGSLIVTGNLKDLESYAVIGTYAEDSR